MKFSSLYDPEQWTFTKEVLTDGTTVLHFDNGAVASYPPLPEGDALERMAKRACEANYKILRRIAAEKLENENNVS